MDAAMRKEAHEVNLGLLHEVNLGLLQLGPGEDQPEGDAQTSVFEQKQYRKLGEQEEEEQMGSE